MPDPAVEAAQRAWESRTVAPFSADLCKSEIAAAREMAKPIRELHYPYISCDDGKRSCVECEFHWPCDTAKLIYSTEELA